MQGLNPGRPTSSSSARVSPAALKRIRSIYGAQTDSTSHSELLLLRRLKEQRQQAEAARGDAAVSDANLDGNLQKLRKRIRKLSQKIVEAEKGKLVKLYESPAKRAPAGGGAATPPPIDIVAELRRIRLEKEKAKADAAVDKKAARGKKRKKRKKAVVERDDRRRSTSSSTVQSWDSIAFHSDLPKARKPDILRMIKDREGGIMRTDSDVESSGGRRAPPVLSDKPPLPPPSRERTIADLAVSLHGILGRKSQVSSAKSSLVSLATVRSRRAAAPKVVGGDAKGSQYAACLASLANVFGAAEKAERAAPSVPEYLEQIKTSRVKRQKKKGVKAPPDDVKAKPSESKDKVAGDEAAKVAKPALKKATATKKKPKKEHVLFAESPEVAGRKENTITVKKALEESSKSRRHKKSKSKKEAASPPPPGGDAAAQPAEPPPKKASGKSRLKKRLSIDIPVAGTAEAPSSKEQAAAPPADARQACKKIQRKNTDTLVNLNAQMSNTLRESIAHLNEICMRVRSTLSDMERDEMKYNKKRRTSDMSSECGSNVDVATFSVVSIHADASEPRFAENVEAQPPIEVIKSIGKDDGLDRLLTTISMQGDDYSDAEAKNSEKARRKRVKKVKREEAAKEAAKEPQPQPPPPPDPPVHTVIERPPLHRIPIWDRKPPSVINDIQLMVKRQATRSQYKEFMRNLRRQSARTKSSVVVLQPSRTSLDNAAIKLATKQAAQRAKEAADRMKTKPGRCSTCSSDRCTCGVVVENVAPSASAQKMQWIRTRSSAARRAIQVYDILDEITPKDIEPIQSEYPRKDHIFSEQSVTKIEDTLLYQLLYNESPQVLESLLRSSSASIPTEKTPILSSYRERERLKDEVQRPNLVSTAYQMYEKLELTNERAVNNDNNNASVNNQDNLDNIVAVPVEVPKPKMDPIRIIAERLRSPRTKQKRPEEIAPIDLFPPEVRKQTVAVQKKCPSKFCTVKVRAEPDIGDGEKTKPAKRAKKTKKSSQAAEKKRAKQRKKDLIKPKLKPYLMDATNVDLNRILTVMRVSVRSSTKIPTVDEMSKRDKRFPTRSMPKISEENRLKIASMSKREIIQKLAPYIFIDIQPRVITVMPVFTTKYNQQPYPAVTSRVKSTKGVMSPTMMSPRREAPKRTVSRDHGDVSSPALRKFCNRCEQMQNVIVPTAVSTRVPKRALRPRSTSRGIASSKSPVAERKPSSTENVGDAAAVLTRKKLNEVKSLVNQNKDCFPKDLNRAIEDIEFKIVNVLSNPVCKHADAFLEIEEEIRSILTTMGSGGKPDKKALQPTKSMFIKSKRNDTNRTNVTSSSTSKSSTNIVFAIKPIASKEKNSTSKDNLQPFQEEEPKSFVTEDAKDPEQTGTKNAELDEPKDSEREKLKCPEEEEAKSSKPDETTLNPIPSEPTTKSPVNPLTEDIEKAIQGLDALMSIGSTDISRRESNIITEVSLTESSTMVNVECKEAMTTFCAQVDKAIHHINAVQSTDVPDADDYLTPYMRAVKQYQESERSQNLMEFLDKLTDLSSRDTILSKDASCPYDEVNSEETRPVIVSNICLVTDDEEEEEEEPRKSEETFLPSGRLSTILSVGKSTDNIEDKVYDDNVDEEVLLPVRDVVSDDSKEFKDCEPVGFFVTVETSMKNESVDNYCQATGLQDVGQQIDLDDVVVDLEGKKALEEATRTSVSTATCEKPDNTYVNADMQTLASPEVFDEIQKYVRTFHRRTVGCEPIEEIRQETFKREIVQLEFEHEKLLMRDAQQNVSSSSGNDEADNEEPSVDSLHDDNSKFYTDVSLNVNLPSTATDSYNPFDLLDSGTQVPSDDDHEWFVPTASADIQASMPSKDTSTNTAVAARAKKELCFNSFSASICSGADIIKKPQLISVSTETAETRAPKAEKATTVDATLDTIAIVESASSSTPEDAPLIDQVRTDTCLALSAQDKKLTVTETLLAKNAISLDLISLFDATRKKTEATDDPVAADGSASQLLQAISQFLAEADNGLRLQQQQQRHEEEHEANLSVDGDEYEGGVREEEGSVVAIPNKVVGDYSPRYGILLNSVYGLIFTIVFLGLNMNYTC